MSVLRNAYRESNGPVLILAGGTGGHIFPGLSVAAELQSRGVAVAWLGAEGGMETRLVPQHAIAIDAIAVKGLRGKGLATLLGAPVRVLGGVRAASRGPAARSAGTRAPTRFSSAAARRRPRSSRKFASSLR